MCQSKEYARTGPSKSQATRLSPAATDWLLSAFQQADLLRGCRRVDEAMVHLQGLLDSLQRLRRLL